MGRQVITLFSVGMCLLMVAFWATGLVSVVLAQNPPIDTISLENPLKDNNINDFDDLLEAILNILLVLAVPIIVFFIIYAGFKYVLAQGKEEELQKANRMLFWSIIGGLIILGARVIFAVIKGTVDSFGV